MKRILLASCAVSALLTSHNTQAQVTPTGIALCQTQPASIAATAASQSLKFGTCGTTAILWNVGTTAASVKICNSSTCVATSGNAVLPPGTGISVSIDPAGTWIAAITAGTTTINIVQGFGMPTIAGGSGGTGGGGGGGEVTQGTIPWIVGQATAANLNMTAVQATAANLNMTEASATAILSAVQAAIPAGTNLIGKVGIDQSTAGSSNLVSVAYGTTSLVANPCQAVARSYVPISIATNSTTKIITGTSLKKTYICNLFLVTASANNIAVVEGAASCTAPTGIIGGATAAVGLPLSANSGFSVGNGVSAIAVTATTANDVCLISSATGVQYSGVATYVQQ